MILPKDFFSKILTSDNSLQFPINFQSTDFIILKEKEYWVTKRALAWELDRSAFQCYLCYFLALWHWATFVTSLSLSFLICKVKLLYKLILKFPTSPIILCFIVDKSSVYIYWASITISTNLKDMKEKDSPYSQETQTPTRKTCNLYIKGIY